MTTLGRYEVLERLGIGSMGTVYRARDTVLDRLVALKTIRTEAGMEPELRERFYREARACAHLQHPNIIVVYDLGEIDQTAYFAMELLSGSDLRKLIEQRVDVPLSTKLAAMADVCDALSHAHRQGIIHRDVKPSNLFLTANNRVKVLDFGIARLTSSRLTVAGKILGTPNYMAPEQILGRPADPRSDLFSAAVVFFEFLVYSHPFKAELIPRRIADGEPDSLLDYDRRLPAVLEQIFARALAKNPADRYATGLELAADLRAVADGSQQNASPLLSRLQLPSERGQSAVSVSAISDPSILRTPPLGQDSDEWRFSEVMRIIPEFEAAADENDAVRASRLLAQLEAIQATDSRFAEAVRRCRERLNQLEPNALGADTSRAQGLHGRFPPDFDRATALHGTEQPTALTLCSHCGAANRTTTVHCIECGTRLLGSKLRIESTPAPAPMPVPPPSIDIDATIIGRAVPPKRPATAASDAPAITPAPARPQEPSRQPPPPAAPKRLPHLDTGRGHEARSWWGRQTASPNGRMRLALITGGGLVCLILLGVLAKIVTRVPVEPFVATAIVANDQASLYRTASANSLAITLSKGEMVHVLKLPDSRGQEWAFVQFVRKSGPSRPGYMRLFMLNGWESSNPETALALIRLFHEGDSGSSVQITEELNHLQKFVDRFPATPPARKARLLMAQLLLTSLQRQKDGGHLPSDWQAGLASAATYLDEAGADPSLTTGVNDARLRINALGSEIAASLAPPSPGPTPPSAGVIANTPAPISHPKFDPREIDKQVGRFLAEAKDLWEGQKFDEAAALVSRAAKLRPTSPDVLEFQSRIEKRNKILEK